MSDSELFLYALVAAFFAYRLWSVLGKTNGTEKGRAAESAAYAEKLRLEQAKKDAPKTILAVAKKEPAVAEDVPAIIKADYDKARKIDPNFTLAKFLEGASGAFDIVVKAYSDGKKEALKFLLSPEIYAGFEENITARAAQKIVVSSNVYSLKKPEILDMEVNGNNCQITVKFESEQFNFTTNETGEVIEGSKTELENYSDIWTFERDLTSKKPNWVVVGIQSA